MWATQATASSPMCRVTVDPPGDVISATGEPFADDSRDLLELRASLTKDQLRFELRVVDLLAVPSIAPGDLFRTSFFNGDKQLTVDVSRRLVATPVPYNTDYAHVREDASIKVTATVDPAKDTVVVVLDKAGVERFTEKRLAKRTVLTNLLSVTAPAVTDEGTPAWADFAGRPGSNGAGVSHALNGCVR